jgi:hypothetical protein
MASTYAINGPSRSRIFNYGMNLPYRWNKGVTSCFLDRKLSANREAGVEGSHLRCLHVEAVDRNKCGKELAYAH